MQACRQFLDTPLRGLQQSGIALVIALSLIFAPQVEPNDWTLNTSPLVHGSHVYEDGNYVYPPWALILMTPYRWMTAAGARVLSALVVIALAYRRGWSLGRFLALVVNPFFVFSALFSNLDLLVLTFPALLWETLGEQGWLGRGVALALLLLKPQGVILFVPYILWRECSRWRQLLLALGVSASLTIPIGLLGSPPLIVQWLRNVASPSKQNSQFWAENNISLTQLTGLLPAALMILIAFGGVYLLMRRFDRPWTNDHTTVTLLLSGMLLSPYTSAQSIIAALVFVPSWPATLIHLALTFFSGALGLFKLFPALWVIVFGISALWFSTGRIAVNSVARE